MLSPYETCPILETDHFLLRLVSEEDAEDLLVCYSDTKSQAVFDSENFISNLFYTTVDEMTNCIRFWLQEYGQKMYVRFAVVDKDIQKPIGTVEMFNAKGHLNDYGNGILRIDLASRYESTEYISELLQLANDHFYELFGVDLIVIKGRPAEKERVHALTSNGYSPYRWDNPDRKHYYSRAKDT
jgi:[ribosomal protein S5]-alanine N-acetyltransferase